MQRRAEVVYILILVLSFILLPDLSAQTTLSLGGTVSYQTEKVPSAVVTLIRQGKSEQKVLTDKDGKFRLKLHLNTTYVVEVSKQNYISQRIIIDTRVPKSVLDAGGTNHGLSNIPVTVYPKYPDFNVSVFNKPISKYIYDRKEKKFIIDEKYRKEVSTIFDPALKELKQLQTFAVINQHQLADSLMSVGNLEEAYLAVQKAISYDPESKTNYTRLKSIEQEIKDEYDDQERYGGYIEIADKQFAQKNYDNAEINYEKAGVYKPGDSYVERRLESIDSIRAKKELASKPVNYPDLNFPEDDETELTQISDETFYSDQQPSENVEEMTSEERTELIKEYISQLRQLKAKNEQEEAGVILEKIGTTYYLDNNLSEALNYYEQALETKWKNNDKEGASEILNNIATVYYDSGRYEDAAERYLEAISLQDVAGNKQQESALYENVGQVYENTYNYDNAIKYYEQSLAIAEEINDAEQKANLYDKIANVYSEKNEHKKAIENYEKKLKIIEKTGDKEEISSILNKLGSAYYGLRNYDKAVEYYERSLEETKEQGDEKQMSIALNNLGNVNFDWEKYNDAIKYYEQSAELKKQTGYDRGLAISLFNIGNSYYQNNEKAKAIDYFEQSLEVSEELNYEDISKKNYKVLSTIYSENNDFKKAYDYQKQYEDLVYEADKSTGPIMESVSDRDYDKQQETIESLKKQLQKQRLLAEYQAEQKQKEIDLQNLELKAQGEKLKRQRVMIFLGIIVLVALAVVSVLIFLQYQIKKKNNIVLKKKNDLISFQNKQITDSIEYASKIQRALLPPEDYITNILPEHFILNKPRDIVSGDYYWTTQLGDESIIAVADCTGHGVPGAFMSMLGIAFLNEIVNKKSAMKSDEILNDLRQHVIQALHQTKEDSVVMDGMDIALCIINTKKLTMQYSGAQNPLYLIRKNELLEYKADKMPIGISFFKKASQDFTTNKIDLKKGDVIYIFSDGYADQFGGEPKKKFGTRRFKELLIEIHQKKSDEQLEILEKTITDFRGNFEQIDDMMVMGIKI